LVPIDDGEILFQSEKVIETPYFVDHGQPGTLLDQQEHGVGGVFASDADPLRRVPELHCVERVELHFPSSNLRTHLR
jgi:hypothetical protein